MIKNKKNKNKKEVLQAYKACLQGNIVFKGLGPELR